MPSSIQCYHKKISIAVSKILPYNRKHFIVIANKVTFNEQYIHEEVPIIDWEAVRIQIIMEM